MRIWIAFFFGIIVTVIADFLIPFITRGFFWLPPIILTIFKSPVIACLIGAVVTGYLCKKRGALWGSIVAYCSIFVEITFLFWMTSGFPSVVRNAKDYTSDDVKLQILLYSTAVILGMVGGKIGELLSRQRVKPKGP